MTNTMLLVQVVIPALSIAATACAQLEFLNARRWAPVLGLCVQPFWFYSALHTSPVQAGVVVTACFFTLLWMAGFWEQWVRPLLVALGDGEWGLWWYRSYDTQAFFDRGNPFHYPGPADAVRGPQWAETEIDAEQWARYAGLPADGMNTCDYSNAVDQSEEIERRMLEHRVSEAIRQQKLDELRDRRWVLGHVSPCDSVANQGIEAAAKIRADVATDRYLQSCKLPDWKCDPEMFGVRRS